MAEDFENYDAMTAEVRNRVDRWSEDEDKGVVLADDLAQVESRLRDMVDAVIQRFDELHERVWRLEDRICRLESADGMEGPSRH